MDKKHILVIDDEEKILDLVKRYLEQEGFTVFTATTGAEGLELARQQNVDLVVLDLLLPDISGYDVCRELQREKNLPIIMLTAKSEEVDKLLGLELGADDYITKPFSLRELTARIRAVLRRTSASTITRPHLVTAGDLRVDLDACEVYRGGKLISLTPTEFKLLATLITNPGRVYSRLQLLDAALGNTYPGYERSIDTHISNLRRKIEPDPSRPRYILTVYGLGYRFAPGGGEEK